ncbi:hypothetical protein MKZ38_000144 [Zalerion maritima]|uniref:Uncharacterized protein n=1 Tax=Zalerion maritima TaxID=339359 RepID=A0AAD5RFZ1_9PEZI|nr:hypothetical protein MKZ38_000144 [Zalerion maritima]
MKATTTSESQLSLSQGNSHGNVVSVDNYTAKLITHTKISFRQWDNDLGFRSHRINVAIAITIPGNGAWGCSRNL